MPDYEYVLKPLPALRLADLSAHVDSTDAVGAVMGGLFGRLMPALASRGGINGPSVNWYEMDAEGEGMTVHAAWPYSGAPADEFDLVTLGASAQAAATTYVGPIAGIGDAWQALASWWSEQGLQPCGPCRELTLTEPPADPNGDWVIELQQPVAPV